MTNHKDITRHLRLSNPPLLAVSFSSSPLPCFPSIAFLVSTRLVPDGSFEVHTSGRGYRDWPDTKGGRPNASVATEARGPAAEAPEPEAAEGGIQSTTSSGVLYHENRFLFVCAVLLCVAVG